MFHLNFIPLSATCDVSNDRDLQWEEGMGGGGTFISGFIDQLW